MANDRAVTVRVGHEASSFIALRTGGSFPITIETHDLAQLRRQLIEAHDDLRATISFAPSSGYFSLVAEGDGRGHYAMRCGVGRGSRGVTISSFDIECDQSYLPAIIEELDAALERFPVR